MAEALLLAQVRIPMASSDSEDAVVNAWHFWVADTTSTNLDSLTAALNTFYGAIDGVILSDEIDEALCEVRYYNLLDSKPRIPIRTQGLNALVTIAEASHPHEVCIAMSYRAAFTSGVPKARRRGRLYLGPLRAGSVVDGLITATAYDAVSAAGEALQASSDGQANWKWAVYSPKTDETLATLSSWAAVTGGWVDNAVDIQRRRGLDPTTFNPWGAGKA